MYPEVDGWMNQMISKLEHGMYWHIPRSGNLLRIDKNKKRFVIVKGDKKEKELISLTKDLKRVGYDLITRDEEVGYYTC